MLVWRGCGMLWEVWDKMGGGVGHVDGMVVNVGEREGHVGAGGCEMLCEWVGHVGWRGYDFRESCS